MSQHCRAFWTHDRSNFYGHVYENEWIFSNPFGSKYHHHRACMQTELCKQADLWGRLNKIGPFVWIGLVVDICLVRAPVQLWVQLRYNQLRHTYKRWFLTTNVVFVLLFNIHGKQLWSCRDGLNLTAHLLGRFRFPKRLTSTQCPFFRQ